MEEKKNFESWAILELMGHQKIAGYLTEMVMGGTSLLRMDVPETDVMPAFTRIFNPLAVYAINPCTEEMAVMAAKSYRSVPVMTFDMQRMVDKMVVNRLALADAEHDAPDIDDDDNDEPWND